MPVYVMRRALLCASLCLVAGAIDVAAQSQNEPIPFSLANPGARSLSLGGAFVGLADDATAALTNPAGLVVLRAPEFSAEFRARKETFEPTYAALFADRGSIPPFSVSSKRPSYISFVYPRARWAVAAYRQEFGRSKFSDPLQITPTLTIDTGADVTIDTYGAAVGVAVKRRLKVGGSVAANFGSAEVRTFGLASNRFVTITGTQDSTDVTGSVGVLGTVVERPQALLSLLQVGAQYRQTTRRAERQIFGPAEGVPAPGMLLADSPLLIPTLFTVGGAARFASRATLTAEYQRVDRAEPPFAVFTPEVSHIPRLGFEYVMPTQLSPALRIGYWHDPAFSFKVTGRVVNDMIVDGREVIVTQDHIAAGFGFSFTQQFEANVGVDVSQDTRTIIASAIVRLPRQ